MIAASDTGTSRRCANFLLAWWNAQSCGGFDFTDFWSTDDNIVLDMLAVIGYVAANRVYPNELGYGRQFEALVRDWRPALVKGKAS